MAITRIKNSTISNRTPKYNDVLAGLPFRPIIGTASDGGNGTSVSVAFTGNNVANGTITYTALSSPGSFTGTGTASPITVSGLTAGTAYTFQVKAGNSLGDSAYSAASNSVTPVTPTAFESIASTTATGGSSVTFSSIPGTYQSLQLRIMAASTTDYKDFRLTANASATGYASHFVSATGTTPSATGYSSASNIRLDSGAAYGLMSIGYSVYIIDIHDYASTTRNKTFRMFFGADYNTSGGEVCIASGLWTNTSAITSLKFEVISGNFANPSQFALYGIKGA